MLPSQLSSYPENPAAGAHDKFSKFTSQQNKDFLTVPFHIYELFKGLALVLINLQRNEHLTDSELDIEHWQECNTHFVKQFPEFVFWAQAGFSERSALLPFLRGKKLHVRHEKLMAEYKNTYTKDRLDLINAITKLKDGTLSLD